MPTTLKRTTIFLTPDQHERLRRLAFEQRTSMARLLRDAAAGILEDKEGIREGLKSLSDAKGTVTWKDDKAARKGLTKKEIKKILSENKAILKKHKIKSIALFGSYVKGEQREDSDIDLLVEFEEDRYKNFIDFVYALEDLLHKEVTVVTSEDLSPYIRPYVLKEAETIEGR